MAAQSETSIDQTWQQTLDPVLLRRLWRPVEQPGLVRPGTARTILARHQGMVGGLPLAERANRRAGPLPDMPAAQAPIVYAQPRPWPVAPGDPTSTSPLQAVESSASPRPIVPATLARQAQPLIARQPPAPAAPGASSTMVVQRKADPSAAGLSAVPPLAAPGLSAVPPLAAPARPHPLAALPLPPRHPAAAAAVAGRSSHISAARSNTQPDSDEPTPMPSTRAIDTPIVESLLPLAYAAPARPVGSLSSPLVGASGLPLVYPRRSPPAAGVAMGAAPEGETARLVVRSAPGRLDAPIGAAPYWEAIDAAPATLVVREQITRQTVPGANLPAAQPRRPLPLVAAAQVAAGQPTAAQPAAERSAPAAWPDRSQIRPAPAPDMAARGTQTKRLEQPAIDIDRIVDKVHRKFLQRLAIEGERRGVR